MKKEGAQTSTKYFRSSLRTQWYWKDLHSLGANAEQFFLAAAISYAVRLVGHFETLCTVCTEALQRMVKASPNLICKLVGMDKNNHFLSCKGTFFFVIFSTNPRLKSEARWWTPLSLFLVLLSMIQRIFRNVIWKVWKCNWISHVLAIRSK